MSTEKQQLYDEKLERVKKASNLEKVDRVPVISMAQTWAIDYAGSNAQDCFSSVDREFEVYAKHLLDFDFDGTALFGMNRPLPMYESLGFSPFFFSKDGISIQHSDNCILPDEEIDEYIANPILYLRNKSIYRRFPALQQDFPKDIEALGNALQLMFAHKQKTDSIPGYLREHVGTPMINGDLMEPALDRYIGYRSFAKGMSDLRRRPEKVLEALEATYPIVAPAPLPMQDFPWVFYPVVTITYLNRKNFEKFFWPTAKRSMEKVVELGGKVSIALEGSWSHVYDYLLELPKGSVIAFIEGDDFIQAKKDLGDKICIAGGMDFNLFQKGTKEECIESMRRILGECGTQGIMITNQKGLISPGDINVDNLRAAIDFIHEYKC